MTELQLTVLVCIIGILIGPVLILVWWGCYEVVRIIKRYLRHLDDLKTKTYLEPDIYYVRDFVIWELIRESDGKTLTVSMYLGDLIHWYRSLYDTNEERRIEYVLDH